MKSINARCAKTLAALGGLKIHVRAMSEQWRFPRTKKRRIRAKWEFREENRRQITNVGFRIGGDFYCTPDVFAEIQNGAEAPPSPQSIS